MTETLAQRAAWLARELEQFPCRAVDESVAPTLRELAAANATLATERNDALAAIASAEHRAANAEAALEAMTAEVAARVAEAVAQEREALLHVVEHTRAVQLKCEAAGKVSVPSIVLKYVANTIRVRKDSTP